MKPWLVIRFDAGQVFTYGRADRIRAMTGLAQVGTHREATWRGDITEEQAIYGVDSEADAVALQDYLITQFPRNTYLVAQTKNASYRPMGERVRAVFTPDGLLPV